MIKVYHYNALTAAEEKRINGKNGGWDSEPRFSRYADITSGFADTATIVKAMLEGEYHEVAVVDGDKDDAFRLTNHIESAWQENAGVDALPGRHRSTSVGDIMEDEGTLFVVASMGFEKINSFE